MTEDSAGFLVCLAEELSAFGVRLSVSVGSNVRLPSELAALRERIAFEHFRCLQPLHTELKAAREELAQLRELSQAAAATPGPHRAPASLCGQQEACGLSLPAEALASPAELPEGPSSAETDEEATPTPPAAAACPAALAVAGTARDRAAPLHLAASQGDLEAVRRLVDTGADPEAAMPDGCLRARLFEKLGKQRWLVRQVDGATPLVIAACWGHMSIVRQLCKYGVDRDEAAKGGCTPLIAAAHQGHMRVVHYLCSVGADKDKPTLTDADTALMVAAHRGYVHICKFLCKIGAKTDVRAHDGSTPLLAAARYGHVAIVRLLCDAQADVGTRGMHGTTPLVLAAALGHLAVVRSLREAGADTEGAAAAAASAGHEEVVRYLRRQDSA